MLTNFNVSVQKDHACTLVLCTYRVFVYINYYYHNYKYLLLFNCFFKLLVISFFCLQSLPLDISTATSLLAAALLGLLLSSGIVADLYQLNRDMPWFFNLYIFNTWSICALEYLITCFWNNDHNLFVKFVNINQFTVYILSYWSTKQLHDDYNKEGTAWWHWYIANICNFCYSRMQ